MDATTVARLAISINSTMVRRPSSTQQKPYFTRNFYPMEKPWDFPILKTKGYVVCSGDGTPVSPDYYTPMQH
ncbi:hypothetical protein SDC9_127285 [bioreactor metagenome]|uniref:Uncharacterized protein n=1 Tax=bioreactor metagenome TaxID=1076179 RepID=A0A645CTP0_9ZZZZ